MKLPVNPALPEGDRRASCPIQSLESGSNYITSISHCDGPKEEERETYVLGSPYNKAGAFTCCFPSLHLLHLNVSCVSHIVSVLNLNNCLRSSWVK